MDWEIIKLAVEGIVIAGAAGGTVYSFYRASSWATGRILRTLRVGDGLHHHFGDSPAAAIRELVAELQASDTEQGIRQWIAENHLGIALFVSDPEGRVTWTSPRFCDLFGLDSQQSLDFGWLAAVDADEKDRVHSDWIGAVENERPYKESYTLTRDGRGRPTDVTSEAWPARDREHVIVMWVGVVKEEGGFQMKGNDDTE